MGMIQAYHDRSDIISYSQAGGAHWSEDPIAVVMERLVEKGVICVASAGNDGADGLFPDDGGSPAVGHGVASVASSVSALLQQNLTVSSYTVGSADNATSDEFAWQVGDSNDLIP